MDRHELMSRIAFSRIWTDVKDHFEVATNLSKLTFCCFSRLSIKQ